MQTAVTIGADDLAEGRLASRRTVTLGAVVRRAGDAGAKVTLLDLSTSGFRVEVSSKLMPGSYVWLRLPGLSPLDARVAWCDGIQMGARFEQPLHQAIVERIVAADRG